MNIKLFFEIKIGQFDALYCKKGKTQNNINILKM